MKREVQFILRDWENPVTIKLIADVENDHAVLNKRQVFSDSIDMVIKPLPDDSEGWGSK